MMTRRQILLTGAQALLANSLLGQRFIHSSLGSKSCSFVHTGEGGITARDYVRDGLMAMWDGIENAGFGKHDSNSLFWRDLIGGNDAEIKSGSPWGWTDNSFSSDNATNYQVVAEAIGSDKPVSIDICYNEFRRSSTHPFIIRAQGVQCVALGTNTCIGGGFPLFQSIGEIGAHTVHVDYSMPMVVDGDVVLPTVSGSDTWYNQAKLMQVGYYGNNRWPFWGEIHCIRFYDRSLSAEEIAYNYEIDQARFFNA